MLSVLLCSLAILSVHAVDWDVTTPLDEYVHSDDGYWSYEVIQEYDEGDLMIYILNMTSQKWQGLEVMDRPIWWHYLSIIVPQDPQWTDSAFLFTGGGVMNDPPPTPETGRMQRLAKFSRNVGAVSAYLQLVPNQPILFVNVTLPRVEDSIIAYTWKLLIEDEGEDEDLDRTLNLLYPMTKSVKRALDTIEDFVPTVHEGIQPVEYMVTGYSKRGWTTWLIACTDQRVFAIAPTVFDLLGAYENLHHHNRAMGGWSWAFAPYWAERVPRYLNHPRTQLIIIEDIDPMFYNERMTMPKMLIVGGNDQFFPPDGSHYFWDELTEPKYMCLWENDEHSLGNHQDEIDNNLEAFFIAAKTDFNWPTVRWIREAESLGGSITVFGDRALEASGWVMDTTNNTCETWRNDTCRRDTRFTALVEGATGNWWQKAEVEDQGAGSFYLEFPTRDDDRFRAFFIEMKYGGPNNYVFRFSTEVNIIPDVFPHKRCVTERECQGILV